MGRKWRYVLWVYLTGALLMEAALVADAYGSGGFQREHSMRDLLIIAVLYFMGAALWPILIAVGILQYFGLLPQPIAF